MKRAILVALIVAVVTTTPFHAEAAPSADKIISRYTKAQGKKALRRVTTTVVTGSVSADGRTGRFSRRYSGPDRLVREIEVAGAVAAEGYNGKSAWRRDADGVRTLVDLDARSARLHAILANARFQDLKRYRVVARVIGNAAVDGRPAMAVELTLEGARERVFFDAESGLPVKHQRTVEGRTEEVFYGDYRRVGGVLEPFSIRVSSNGREARVTVERVEHNLPVDERAFHVPAPGADRPLPDVVSLLESVRENVEKVREMQERYAFRETRTEWRDDGRGGLKEGDTRVYRAVPVAGRLVRELVSVNGRELTPAEREKERKRAAERTEEVLEESRKRRERAERAAAEGKAEEKEEGAISIATFLDVSEISSVRRERLRGRELLAFDFEPREDFKPNSLAQNIASKLAGTIWVDEAALQVVRLEARLTNKVKIGGGLLASLSPDSTVVLEQAKINDEVWLPSFEDVRISGKLLLLKKIELNLTARFSDYERYDVESDYTATP